MGYSYNPKSLCADEFINDEEIEETLAYRRRAQGRRAAVLRHFREVQAPLASGKRARRHDHHREASVLLACEDAGVQRGHQAACARHQAGLLRQPHRHVRAAVSVQLLRATAALYCPYHAKNREIPRRKLTQDEIRAEVIALQDMGHKRLAIEAGEDPKHNPIEYILESMNTIYSIKHKNGAIRRVNVNIAATTVEKYRMLKEAEHRHVHPVPGDVSQGRLRSAAPHRGRSSDYDYHTEAMDRAMEGGIDDVGLGVLFGLERLSLRICGLHHARRALGGCAWRGAAHH